MPLTDAKSRTLERTLGRDAIHDQWDREYRSPHSAAFFNDVLDRVDRFLPRDPGVPILDAGCGSGQNTIHLARRGHAVHAVDFAEPVLEAARRNVAEAGFSDRVRFGREDLLGLSFPDGTFQAVLCWGVLMHIADVEAALSELARVVEPGGVLILSEINLGSLQRRAFAGLTRLFRRPRAPETRAPAGMECWFETPAGPLLRRHTDMGWLIPAVESRGFLLRQRLPGQFTELYLKLGSPTARAWVHRLNRFWFRVVRDPRLAFGNVLVFEKATGSGA